MHINGSVIKSRRAEYNLTQLQLSNKTGVSKSSISRMENDSNNGNIRFIDAVKIMKVLDLSLDELIITVTKSIDTKVLKVLDEIREARELYLIEDTLNQLTLQQWRSTTLHSVYYDWHMGLMYLHKQKYKDALAFIDKTLNRLDDLPSLEYLKVSVYTSKGYVLHLLGEDGNPYYKSAIYMKRIDDEKLDYRTRVRLLSYMMDSNIKVENYDLVDCYGKRAMHLLKENESTYMVKRIKKLCEKIKQYPV